MAAIRIRRQAVTPRGIERRVADLDLRQVHDPRDRRKVEFGLDTLLTLLVLGAVSGARSMRQVELLSEQMRSSTRALVGLDDRVADNTLGTLLRRLEPSELRSALHRQVKKEVRRENLKAVVLPWSTAAIDGKHVSTLYWHSLVAATVRVLAEAGDPRTADAEWTPTMDDVRTVFSTRFPHIQLVEPSTKGQQPYGLVRVHRTTLVSSPAAVCIDERPLPGASNEIGEIVRTATELLDTYRRTNLVQMVTVDAGNTCAGVATLLRDRDVHYFMAIKSPQGDVHAEAERVFNLPGRRPDFTCSEDRSGRTVAYEAYVEPLPNGHLAWTHARSLVRVRRTTRGNGVDDITEGNRYYVCSVPADELEAKGALALSRMHWRCENEGHWTSDAILSEDARQAPWTRHPTAVLVVSSIRMIAQNILAVFRALSHIRTSDDKFITPPWKAVIQHFIALLFEPLLESMAFDA